MLGIRENIGAITQEQLKEFHTSNFVGDRMVVVGTGNVNPLQFKDLAAQHFGTVKKDGPQVFFNFFRGNCLKRQFFFEINLGQKF